MLARMPSRRGLAALAKIHGYRLERRFPFLIKARGASLNLSLEDLLEFQYCRTRLFRFLAIGAFDGLANDPLSHFVRSRHCSGVFVEPQPEVFARLRENYREFPQFQLVNAAVAESHGSRLLYYVPGGVPGLPAWTEQLASFRIEHLLSHEREAPGLTAAIQRRDVPTVTFGELIDSHGLGSLDVLQIDAEGMDAELLGWFPFERLRPGLVHYEVAHTSPIDRERTQERLRSFAYRICDVGSATDEAAIRL